MIIVIYLFISMNLIPQQLNNMSMGNTIQWKSLAGEEFGELTFFECLAKKFGVLVDQ